MLEITLYTDGSCLGNPGPGGWGYTLEYGNYRVFGADGHPETTCNIMELTAVIEGLKKITERHIPVTVYSDSTYVVNGITSWIDGWKKRGWKTSRGDKVANRELWLELEELLTSFKNVKFQWIQGHNGNEWNEWCDTLAKEAAELAKMKLQMAVES